MGSVYARKNKLWIAYVDASGKRQLKSTGLSLGEEKKARAVLRKIEERIAAGAALGERELGPTTVERYAKTFLSRREASGLSSAKTARFYLAHALRVLGDRPLTEVRRRDVRDFVRGLELGGQRARGQGLLGKRTIRHVYFTLKAMFDDALEDQLIEVNPCSLRRGQIPRVADKDPTWRRSAVFTREELEQLISDRRIDPARLVGWALQGLAGLRPGEASAARWRYWDPSAAPLGRLDVLTAYDSNNRREKSVKTDNPRSVPVHPVLAAVLAEWKLSGWAQLVGRRPGPDDLIIPVRDEQTATWTFRNKKQALDALVEDLETLGLRRRTPHNLRRTFTTIVRADGARPDLLTWITHGPPKGNILDSYTSPPWETLCEQVACMKIRRRIEAAAVPLAVASRAGQVGSTQADIGRIATPLLHRDEMRNVNRQFRVGELGFEPR